MKTLSQVIKEQSDYKNLINSVVRKIGMNSVQDVIQHGIDCGFNGFIYYNDTIKFWKTHKKDILKLAEDMAYDFGQDTLAMIQGFNCLGKDYSLDEIGRAIYAGKGDSSDQILNAMAWFAAEEVCRMFDD